MSRITTAEIFSAGEILELNVKCVKGMILRNLALFIVPLFYNTPVKHTR